MRYFDSVSNRSVLTSRSHLWFAFNYWVSTNAATISQLQSLTNHHAVHHSQVYPHRLQTHYWSPSANRALSSSEKGAWGNCWDQRLASSNGRSSQWPRLDGWPSPDFHKCFCGFSWSHKSRSLARLVHSEATNPVTSANKDQCTRKTVRST